METSYECLDIHLYSLGRYGDLGLWVELYGRLACV